MPYFDELHLATETVRAEEDFTDKAGYAVVRGAAQNGAVLAGAAADTILGVLRTGCANGEVVTIVKGDGSLVVGYGADAITLDALVTTDADGAFVPAAAGEVAHARAEHAISAPGNILLRLLPGSLVTPA